MADPLLNTKKTLGELTGATQKYEGVLTKMGKTVSDFMNATEGFKGFAKSFLYTFRGSFTILNKLKTNLLITGKVWDKTIGGMSNKNSLLGKSMGRLSKLKIPNFAKALNIPSFESMGKGIKAVTEGALGKKYTGGQFMAGGGRAKKGGQRGLSFMDRFHSGGGIKGAMGAGKKKVGAIKSSFVGATKDAASKRWGQAKDLGASAKEKGGAAIKAIKQFDWIGKSKGLILGVMKLSRTILAKAFNFFIITILVITAIGLALKLVWEGLQSFFTGFMEPFAGFFESIETALHTIWDSFSTIIDFFMGDASFMDMAFAVLDLMVATAYVIVKFAITVLHAILSGLWQLAQDAWDAAIDWFKGLSWQQWAGLALGALAAMVLWMYGLPILLPAIIIGGVLVIAMWLWDRISDWDVFHAGGTSHGGMALVGEKGPELVNLPAGSRVHSNKKSRSMVGGGGGVTNINITINARDTSDGEMRRIASKIGDMVNNKINRTTSSRTMG